MGSHWRKPPHWYFPSGVFHHYLGSGFCLDSGSRLSFVHVFPFEHIATASCAHPLMFIALPIPVPTQVFPSGCYNIIMSSVKFINYILILLFYTGQFPVCLLEFIFIWLFSDTFTYGHSSLQVLWVKVLTPLPNLFPEDDEPSCGSEIL